MEKQRGGTLLGFIAGLILGLAVALGVAIYITKAPVPFMKNANHNAEQDAAEEEKNKDWNPNAPLMGKKDKTSEDNKSDTSAQTQSSSKSEARAPEVKASDAKAAVKSDAATKVDPKSADPLGDLAKSKLTPPAKSEDAAGSKDPFVYYVQAGAYRTSEEAEAQRAKLGLMGLDAKINERDQGGRSVYRVRVGPLQTKEEADHVHTRLDDAHLDSVMIRMQR
jgi:cell division protein FtsN